MNKNDFKFIMAYAEAYGLQDKSVETVLNIIKNDDRDIWDVCDYYGILIDEFIEDFLEAYNVIKITGFEGECFTLMKSGYTIWMALRDWDLPTTVAEAEKYMQHIDDMAVDYFETQLSCKY